MPGAVEHAPAKVNLALHVLVRRPDGYHELDSLVAFASVGDALAGEVAAGLTLALDGPFAGGLPDGPDNLVLRAAVSIRPEGAGAALRLTKRLPVASGLGGGSADAAAALRLLAHLWGVPLPAPAAQVALGADVPACVASRPVRMRGIGERLDPLELPPFWMVLANPGIPVATAAVFRALDPAARAPLPDPPRFESAGSLFAFLAGQRNDLEAPAALIAPAIGEAKAALAAQAGCRLARMAGSGATCFGLFSAEAPARAAASALGLARPEWWIAAAAAGGSAAGGSTDPGASG